MSISSNYMCHVVLAVASPKEPQVVTVLQARLYKAIEDGPRVSLPVAISLRYFTGLPLDFHLKYLVLELHKILKHELMTSHGFCIFAEQKHAWMSQSLEHEDPLVDAARSDQRVWVASWCCKEVKRLLKQHKWYLQKKIAWILPEHLLGFKCELFIKSCQGARTRHRASHTFEHWWLKKQQTRKNNKNTKTSSS